MKEKTREISFGEYRLRCVSGEGLIPWIDALARLRIAVFREFPYLYDGTLSYEADYLKTYLASSRSFVALVFFQDEVVGATTALPLEDESAEFQAPFLSRGIPVDTVFYFGESILLSPHRGKGLGKQFFELREAWARQFPGISLLAFAAVQRPPDHPLRPSGYQPLDAFWKRQGYVRHDSLHTTFSWKDVMEESATSKPMVFWLKEVPRN